MNDTRAPFGCTPCFLFLFRKNRPATTAKAVTPASLLSDAQQGAFAESCMGSRTHGSRPA